MNTEIHTQTSRAIEELSILLNGNGTYKIIKSIAWIFFEKHLYNDSPIWHELEETIIDLIKQHEE